MKMNNLNVGADPCVCSKTWLRIGQTHWFAPTLIVVILMFLSTTNLYSQIQYNIEFPPSYGNENIIGVDELAIINFAVSRDGNLSEENINIDIKDYAILEDVGEKNIARVKFNIDVLSFGNISIGFKDVILNNKAHCYIYTNDNKIVAGPIYQSNINSGYLNIVELPARELILEILYENINDFEFTLNTLNYKNISKNKNNELQSTFREDQHGFCDDCESTYGILRHDSIFERCSYIVGHDAVSDVFNDSIYIHTPNDSDIGTSLSKTSRAASMIIAYNVDSNWYCPRPSVLLNFPDDSCGTGYIVSCYHRGIYDYIKQQTVTFNDTASVDSVRQLAEAYLNSIIIRFNSHYRYGIPWELEDVICRASNENFELWRRTIDWDDVIDYCGVTCFAYSPDKNYIETQMDDSLSSRTDIFILKMNQRPFFKELHLGWSALNDITVDMNVLGRRDGAPTAILKHSSPWYACDIDASQTIWCNAIDYNVTLKGWSGSQFITPEPEPWLGLGILVEGHNAKEIGGTWIDFLNGQTYYYQFCDSLKNFLFLEPGQYYNASSFGKNMYNHYLADFSSDLYTIDSVDGVWMPSVENKFKCPGYLGVDTDPCLFDLSDPIYVYTYVHEFQICCEIDLPVELFPDSTLPKGYRVYHKSPDQNTIIFETFNDGTDIVFPITFCLDPCDVQFYKSRGIDPLPIGIDFYNEEGKVINNPGCVDAEFYIDTDVNYCENNGIIFTKELIYDPSTTAGCCRYRFTLVFPEVSPCIPLEDIMDSYSCSSLNDLNFNIDGNILTVEHEVCGSPDRLINDDEHQVTVNISGEDCLIAEFPLVCACEDCCDEYETSLTPIFSFSPSHYWTGKTVATIKKEISTGCDFEKIRMRIKGKNWIDQTIDTLQNITSSDTTYFSHACLIDTSNTIPICYYFEVKSTSIDSCFCYDTLCRTTIPIWQGLLADYSSTSISVNNEIDEIHIAPEILYTSIQVINGDGGVVLDGGDSHELDITGIPADTYYLVFSQEDIDDLAIEIQIE